MTILDTIKRALGRDNPTAPGHAATADAHRAVEPEEIRVPELTGADLMAARQNGDGLLILDCREDYEWRQGYSPASLHIQMRQIPDRIAEIDRGADIVVACAHGNRTYSVAGWLIGNGYRARSLKGGVTDWQLRGYAIEREHP